MNIIDYAEKIVKIAKEHPTAKVVYAGDDEGNYFNEVHYEPSLGSFDGVEFKTQHNPKKVTAVCIN